MWVSAHTLTVRTDSLTCHGLSVEGAGDANRYYHQEQGKHAMVDLCTDRQGSLIAPFMWKLGGGVLKIMATRSSVCQYVAGRHSGRI